MPHPPATPPEGALAPSALRDGPRTADRRGRQEGFPGPDDLIVTVRGEEDQIGGDFGSQASVGVGSRGPNPKWYQVGGHRRRSLGPSSDLYV